VAIVNVVMLLSGATLVQLVMATTSLRIATYFLYRANAYRVFPALRVQPSRFQWSRVRELTSFSVYVSIIDWSNKLNYSIDAIIIGAYISSAAVALWTVPQRLAEMLQRLTNQLNGVLFPVVVDSDAGNRPERLRAIFLQGTRLSLVSVVPLAAAMTMLADPLIRAWVGPKFLESIFVAQLLILVVAIRVGNATATTVLKGAGQHRLLAWTNAGTAVANIALSLLWIRHYGLIGQAMGTLIPVAFSSIVILWPAACRRVGVNAFAAFAESVWPTLWPIAAMAIVIVPLRQALPARLWAVAFAGGLGSLAYLAAFLAFAVKKRERQLYMEKINELIAARRRRRVTAAAA
jgi:O-antigen/teichoic acid export membrane protein